MGHPNIKGFWGDSVYYQFENCKATMATMRWGSVWLCFLALFLASVNDVQAKLGELHWFGYCIGYYHSSVLKSNLMTSCFIFLSLWNFCSSEPCEQHLQHMGQRALQDVWWGCVPVPWHVWVQPGLRLPRVLPGVLSAHKEEGEWWEPYSQLHGGHHQWPFFPHL